MSPAFQRLPLAAILAIASVCAPADETSPATGRPWVGTWAAAPQAALAQAPLRTRDQTLRLVVHTVLGGRAVRVRLSNLYGAQPLTIGELHLARRSQGASTVPGSDVVLSFGGARSAIVAPGASLLSDPVAVSLAPDAELAVSIFLPGRQTLATQHTLAQQTNYLSKAGDAAARSSFPVERALTCWPLLTAIEVAPTEPSAASVVVFGDSLVDGDGATPDLDHRWPDALAARSRAAGRALAFLNLGLIGNRLLRDGPAAVPGLGGPALGAAGVARFDRDALGQAGARAVILRIGTNDLGLPGSLAPAGELPTAAALEAALADLANRAHAHGLAVIGTTFPPFEGAELAPGYWTPPKETLRQALNTWMRQHPPGFDAIADLDDALADPLHPTHLRPDLDSGDHLHPNDAGYAAAARAVPLDRL